MPECGANTISGSLCKKRVKEGERCFFHRENPTGEQCPICLAELNGPCKTLGCNHTFHRRCILGWKNRGNNTCPMCRIPFMDPIPQYKVTVTIERLSTRNIRNFTSNIIPEIIQHMNILAGDADVTEVAIDVNDRDALEDLLEDLGIHNVTDLF
jgi:hypothetical protein